MTDDVLKEYLKQLEEYEKAWNLNHKFAHKSPELQKQYPKPDMIAWVKLKYKIKELEASK